MDEHADRVSYYLDVKGLRPRRLDDGELRMYREESSHDFVKGWRIVLPTKVGDRDVDVLLEPDYPFAPARIGVIALKGAAGRPKAHVLNDLLCLFGSEEAPIIASDERELGRVLDRAAGLFALTDEEIAAEKRDEFYNYWIANTAGNPFISILSESRAYGIVACWRSRTKTYVGDDDAMLQTWLSRRFAEPNRKFDISKALYLPGDAIRPRLNDGAELLAAVQTSKSQAAMASMSTIARTWPYEIPVVLRLPGDFALVGGYLERAPREKSMKKNQPKVPGFRPGHERTVDVLRIQYSSKSAFRRASLYRADPRWVIARGGEGFDDRLAAATVCVIGVGALGSGIARILAKAGVMKLILIDPEVLTWSNVARHELGGSHVGEFKAAAMAETIGMDFPFVEVRGIASTWQRALRAEPHLFDVDAILSTTGSWADESQLNVLLRVEEQRAALVFGWIEPHCAASQVLTLVHDGGCLGCRMNEIGEFDARATNWANPQIQREPSCMTTYVPYSDVAATRARSLIAQQTMRVLRDPSSPSSLTTEIYDAFLRDDYGGSLTPETVALCGTDRPPTGTRISRAWPAVTTCGVCGRLAA